MCSESTVRAIFRAYGHFPSVYQAPTSPLPVHPHRAVQHPRRGKPSTTYETPHRAVSRFTQTPEYGQFAVLRGGTFTAPWKISHAVEGLPRDGGATRHKTRPRGTVGKITVPRPCRLDVIWVSLLQLIGLDQPRAQGAPAVYEQRSLV